MKRLRCTALALALAAAAMAEVPVRTEQLIWSVIASNGRDYTATFVPEPSPTVYLIADRDSLVSARKTLLYWWPLAEQWRTDTESLNILFLGTLEIIDAGGRVRSLPMQEYTYFNVKGEYEQNWQVVTGEAAREELARFRRLYDEYFRATESYQAAVVEFESEVQRLLGRIQGLRDEGADFSGPLGRLQGMRRPAAPPAPSLYTVPPADLQEAFIVNLPRGRYEIRLRNPDGTIMEGSEKRLVVDGPRRTGSTGYELIPSDKWTRPEESLTPSSVIYVNGSADLYVRPFFEDEYNDLVYQKAMDNQARGNPAIQKWVRIQQVPRASVVVTLPGAAPTVIAEQPFYVEQSEGTSLGYTIIPWDAQGPYREQGPNLIAFRIPLPPGVARLHLLATGADGAVLPGSSRTIRVVSEMGMPWLLLILALVPLTLMAAVLAIRRGVYLTGIEQRAKNPD